MSRSVPIVAALAGVLLLGCLGAAPASADEPEGQSAEEQGPPQEAVAIPYLGETDIPVAPPWSVVGCPAAPEGVAIACAPDRVSLAAPEYDPEWGEHELAVALAGPLGALEVRYRVILAPPEPPAADAVVWGAPVSSGAQVLIPVAALNASCTLCTPGEARLEVGVLDPATAGVATSTGTHVAVRTTPGFTGEAVVPIRLTDDAGQSVEFGVTLRIGPAGAEPLGGLHVLVPVDQDGTATIDLGELAWPAPQPDAAFLCSAPLSGAVTCVDGVAEYAAAEVEPAREAGEGSDAEPPTPSADQFLVRLVAPGGRLALASVTIVPGLAEAALAPVVGARSAALLVRLPPPPEGGSSSGSALEDLVRALDRAGLTG